MILIDKLLSKILNKDQKAEYINLIVDNIHKENLFYIKETIILQEYSNLKTPDNILSFLKELKNSNISNNNLIIDFKYLSSNREFVKASLSYANKKGKFCDSKPLFEYWVTFDMLDEDQLKWYFYFRERTLNGEYIDTDFSYIILFAYELINYTFNNSASFNVSMLIKLYGNYKERQPKLTSYLPGWISDFLFELGENKLSDKWSSTILVYKEPIFDKINEKKDELEKIPFTLWKNYIQNIKQTDFFKENKNKIYNVFKQGISLLSDTYKKQNIDLLKKWFMVTETKHNRNLFASAVMGREVGQIEMTIKAFESNKYLYSEITTLFGMSENIVRDLAKEKIKLMIEEEELPQNFNNLLIDKIRSQRDNKIKDRFKIVQKTVLADDYVSIPEPKEEKKIVKVIEFNSWKIEILSKQSEELQRTFRDKGYEDEERQDNVLKGLEDSREIDSHNAQIFDTLETVSKSGEKDFTMALTDIEKKYLIGFDNYKRAIMESKIYFKANGMMAGTFISKINEKANEYLEDNIIELNKANYEINEEFQAIISNMKEGDKIEH